jgi:hypothetical protein
MSRRTPRAVRLSRYDQGIYDAIMAIHDRKHPFPEYNFGDYSSIEAIFIACQPSASCARKYWPYLMESYARARSLPSSSILDDTISQMDSLIVRLLLQLNPRHEIKDLARDYLGQLEAFGLPTDTHIQGLSSSYSESDYQGSMLAPDLPA